MTHILLTSIIALAAITATATAKDDAETIAATIWHESRGEGTVGMDAVASVIWNRSARSGNTLVGECLKRGQFVCWNGKTHPVCNAKTNDRTYAYCLMVAWRMVGGKFRPSIRSTHFYNPRNCKPDWGSKMTNVRKIGRHLFGEVRESRY